MIAEGVIGGEHEDLRAVVVEIAVAAAHAVQSAVDTAVGDRRLQAAGVIAGGNEIVQGGDVVDAPPLASEVFADDALRQFHVATEVIEIRALVLGEHAQRVDRLPQQLGAQHALLFALFVAAAERVGVGAVHVPVQRREAAREALRKRPREHQPIILALLLGFIKGRDGTFKLIPGPRGDHADRAGNAVLAEQNGLRAAQHFDALKIEHGRARQLPAPVVNAVHVHARGLLETRVDTGTHAANRNIVGNAALVHGEVGNVVG